jgi:hypothetical protein
LVTEKNPLIGDGGEEPKYLQADRVVVSPDTLPKTAESVVSMNVTEQFSLDQPAQITITVQNKSMSARQFKFGSTPPFSSYVGRRTEGESKLLLIPKEWESSGRLEEKCWKYGGKYPRGNDAKTIELGPEETITTEYALFSHSENQNCIPLGTYRFEQDNYVENMAWGFNVEFINIGE